MSRIDFICVPDNEELQKIEIHITEENSAGRALDDAVKHALQSFGAYHARLCTMDRFGMYAILSTPRHGNIKLRLLREEDHPAELALLQECKDKVVKGERRLPNGATVFWKMGEQGREYISDEIGGGVMFWHTAMVDQSTLIAAVAIEMELQRAERHIAEQTNEK